MLDLSTTSPWNAIWFAGRQALNYAMQNSDKSFEEYRKTISGTYVTDLTHFLGSDGQIVAEMPSEARQLASFLVANQVKA